MEKTVTFTLPQLKRHKQTLIEHVPSGGNHGNMINTKPPHKRWRLSVRFELATVVETRKIMFGLMDSGTQRELRTADPSLHLLRHGQS
ncbi:hypothetical protein F2P79_010592 [Pimephales promelas]|nr:hypothetical protein F2P79_010592 [Pimephales promelas]